VRACEYKANTHRARTQQHSAAGWLCPALLGEMLFCINLSRTAAAGSLSAQHPGGGVHDSENNMVLRLRVRCSPLFLSLSRSPAAACAARNHSSA